MIFAGIALMITISISLNPSKMNHGEKRPGSNRESNLIPIKPGEKLALKPESERKTERIPIQVTKARKSELEERARAEKLTLSAYLLKDK